MRFEILEVAKRERAFMRRGEDDFRGGAVIKRFLPARGAKAPAVARLQTGEAPLQVRRRKIVAGRLGECQELGRHHYANGVRADVLGTGVAAAVAKKASHGCRAARGELSAEHVFSLWLFDHTVCSGN